MSWNRVLRRVGIRRLRWLGTSIGGNGVWRAVALPLQAEKVLLSVGANLDGGLGSDNALDGLPFAAVLGESVQETGVFFFGPVLAALR